MTGVMRAAAIVEYGGPEVLRLVEVNEPHAGAGQVRVRVKAAGVQPFDVAVVAGEILREDGDRDLATPRIPGNEFAGVVDEVGDGAAAFAVGDEVLGFGTLNAYGEYIVVGADQICRKPANMPWAVAGGFSAAAQTADIALKELRVGAGDTVLIHGAAGAVGHVAVQLCQIWGADVIGAARPAHHDFLRSLGAVPVGYGAGFLDRVRQAAPRGVVDACLDGVGGDALDDGLTLVADRTRILTLVEHEKAPRLGIRVTPRARSAERLAELAAHYAAGRLTFDILETYPLAAAADAHRRYRAGRIRGKLVLTVG